MHASRIEKSEVSVEDRMPRLETHVEHLQVDVRDIKLDTQAIGAKIDDLRQDTNARIDRLRDDTNARIDRLREETNTKIDALRAETMKRIDDLRAETNARFDKVDQRFDKLEAKIEALATSLSSAKVWALILYIALAGTLLGVMAKGFKWL